jgi:hypothetical protein
METTKLRMKVGDYEFEAEGDTQTVQSQLDAFNLIISRLASKIEQTETPSPSQNTDKKEVNGDPAHVPLEKILHVAGRVVSLTAIPQSTENAALLIMLGHKNLRNNDSVTGQEIGDGLAQSGRPVQRTDRIMEKPISEALVLKSGVKRSTRYRLTNSGNQKALAVARELIATLP